MEYLTVDEIIAIHDRIVEEFDEEKGVINRGSIEFVLSKMKSSRTSVYHKVAISLEGLVKGHAFLEANKRTGLEATKIFLRMNGKDLKIKDIYETGQFINDIARGVINFKEIERWVETHSGEWHEKG